MSGKFPIKINSRVMALALIAVLVAVVAAVALLRQPADGGQSASPSGTQGVTNAAGETQNSVEETTDPGPDAIELGHGLMITEVGPYTGPYVEDGSDEQVTDVLMIVVYNDGEEPIQYAEITLGDANFVMTTLPVGEKMMILEKDRMAYDENADYTRASSRNVAAFTEPMSLCKDKLEIQSLEGAMNIINISGEDIEGDVFIHFKNISDDMLCGGITYRVRLTGGMKANEIRQIMSDHYSVSNSRVMFITCG